jgi:hypothetical protein
MLGLPLGENTVRALDGLPVVVANRSNPTVAFIRSRKTSRTASGSPLGIATDSVNQGEILKDSKAGTHLGIAPEPPGSALSQSRGRTSEPDRSSG